MKIPNFFKVKTEQGGYNYFPLHHTHQTTTDFFRFSPVVVREMIPGDIFTVRSESFGRFFPMPFPTLGRVKFYTRFFFVPNRTIMEGWNSFITQTTYPTSTGPLTISSVPWFSNSQIVSQYLVLDNGLATPAGTSYYWRKSGLTDQTGEPSYVLVTGQGTVCNFKNPDNSNRLCLIKYLNTGYYYICMNGAGLNSDVYNSVVSSFGTTQVGTYSVSGSGTRRTYTLSFSSDSSTLVISPNSSGFGWESDETFGSFDDVVPDFSFGSNFYRFTNKGRHFYHLLTSLGYRVDFTSISEGGSLHIENNKVRSALKLLAFVKVYLDYYRPSQYDTLSGLEKLFYGVHANGRQLTDSELLDIANISFSAYEPDYFTAAWDTPSGPNQTQQSSIDVFDINAKKENGAAFSWVNTTSQHLYPNTPHIHGRNITDDQGSTNDTSYPQNLTKYILDSLDAVSDWMHRNQLSGFRAVDRYLARFGIKLDDDKTNRSYYLGSHEYESEIRDVMSTAETKEGQLGDFAGKGIAYSDQQGRIRFETKEFGQFIVVSSVVPDVGYVQGMDPENYHLTPFQFWNGDFDNLGVDAIRQDELWADGNMWNVRTGAIASRYYQPDKVFGFRPRYAEYKVGREYLTGDFNVPSRREGLDSYHLNRLFDNDHVDHDIDFCIGEQSQYDRIFNNSDDQYDHIFMYHTVEIRAERKMKSITEVIEFEEGGKEIEIPANGTQLS